MYYLYRMVLFSILTTFIIGCGERNANVINSENYHKSGISFSYPGNWEVTEDLEENGYRYIFIESPGDAIAKIEIYDKGNFKLSEFVELDIESLKSEMPKFFKLSDRGEIKELQKVIGEKLLKGYRYEFNLSILGVDVPHVTEYYMFQSKTESAYISNQVAVEDLSKVQNGFNIILDDFKIQKALTNVSN